MEHVPPPLYHCLLEEDGGWACTAVQHLPAPSHLLSLPPASLLLHFPGFLSAARLARVLPLYTDPSGGRQEGEN